MEVPNSERPVTALETDSQVRGRSLKRELRSWLPRWSQDRQVHRTSRHGRPEPIPHLRVRDASMGLQLRSCRREDWIYHPLWALWEF
jgi:hypothetical protein